MGRNFRKGGHGKNRDKLRGKESSRQGKTRQDWDRSEGAIERSNKMMELFYDSNSVVPEEERENFWVSLKTDLPNSFRFAGSRGHALTVQRRLIDRHIPEIKNLQSEGQDISSPTPISWFPDKLAWSMTTPKHVLRKFPIFASFQKFMVSENSVGNITRQEVVSMIPPLFMDINAGMTVLDMCAAPGSKSTQIIEMIHAGEEARVRRTREKLSTSERRELSPEGIQIHDEKPIAESEDHHMDDGRSTGLLIANDKEYKRGQMLIHQCKRLNSPNLIVTNHDATIYPSIRIPSNSGRNYLKYDRILADVPCSGDGTCRKNVNVWRDWQPLNGLGLYTMQLRILIRALQLLNVGGRVVYSTCSMNPIEDEAVVKSAIERCGLSTIELKDVKDEVPGLIRRPGLTSWKVMDKTGRLWNSWAEVVQHKEETEAGLGKIQEGHFSPVKDFHQIPLERCVRIYPHLQDTGAFFVAVLEKKAEIRIRPENSVQIATNGKPRHEEVIENELTDSNTTEDVTSENRNSKIDKSHDSSKTEIPDRVAPSALVPADDFEKSSIVTTNSHVLETSEAEILSDSKRKLESEIADESASRKRLKHREGPCDTPSFSSPLPPLNQLSNNDTALPRSNTVRGKQQSAPEEFFKFLDPNHPDLLDIYEFYNISHRFPKDRFMVRNSTGEPVKAIYYTSAGARDILIENEGKGVKFVHSGVKMFVKQDAQGRGTCRWRIQSEGLPVIEPWIGQERVVRLNERAILQRLLIEMFPSLPSAGSHDLGSLGDQMQAVSMGCCVLQIEPSDKVDGFDEKFVMPLWRGAASLNLMLPKEERRALLLRLFDDVSPLVDNSQQWQRRNVQDQQQMNQEVRDKDGSDEGDDESREGGVPLSETSPQSKQDDCDASHDTGVDPLSTKEVTRF